MNTSSNNETSSSNGKGQVVGLFTFTYSSIGLLLTFLVLWGLVKTKLSRMKTFYVLLINQILADGLCFVFYVLYVAPCEYWHLEIKDNAKVFIGQTYGYIYMINILSTFAISIHRFIIIFHLATTSPLPPLVPILIVGALWLTSLPLKVVDYKLTGCLAELSLNRYSFIVRCLRRKGALSTSALLVYICVHLMGFFYVAAMLKLKWNYRHIVSSDIERLARRDQLRTFCQTAGIWFSFFVNAVAFNFLYVDDPLLNGIVSLITVLLPSYATSVIVFSFDIETRNFIVKRAQRMSNVVLCEPSSTQQCFSSSTAGYQQFAIEKLNFDQNDENLGNFADSGRTGRRNAIFSDSTSSTASCELISDHKMQRIADQNSQSTVVNEDDMVLAEFLRMRQKQEMSMAQLALQMNDLWTKTN